MTVCLMRSDGLRSVRISGLGLVTALGTGVSPNIAGCMQREPLRERYTLEMRGEAVEVPYRSCHAEPRAEFFAPVGLAVEQALSQAQIDTYGASDFAVIHWFLVLCNRRVRAPVCRGAGE